MLVVVVASAMPWPAATATWSAEERSYWTCGLTGSYKDSTVGSTFPFDRMSGWSILINDVE